MTVYLLCYDLQQTPDNQHQQIFYWLEYLNALLETKHTNNFKIIIVGLRADLCNDIQESKRTSNIRYWLRRMPNLAIHGTTFQLSAHTDPTSIQLLSSKLHQQFMSLFGSFGNKIPRLYRNCFEDNLMDFTYEKFACSATDFRTISKYYGDSTLEYLQSIGRFIVAAKRVYNPSFIAGLFAKFVSPKAVCGKLLVRDYGTSASLLTEEEIGVVIEVDNSEKCVLLLFLHALTAYRLEENLLVMCEIGICYAIPATIDTPAHKRQFLFPSLGTKGLWYVPESLILIFLFV